jgi:hypothetical protein
MTVFENRVLRRIFGPKTDDATGERKNLPNEEFQNLYLFPSIIKHMKPRRMMCEAHVARTGEECTTFWWESRKVRDHSEDRGVDR